MSVVLALTLVMAGCYAFRSSQGGGLAEFKPPRAPNPADVALPAGYRMEVVATGLNFPTSVTFDEEGRVYVIEAGYSYGGVFATPRLLRVESDGTTRVIAEGDRPPWNGVTYHAGAFYVAAGGVPGSGAILRITPEGAISDVVRDLPSADHHTNGPVVGPDGWLYFGQGTATNSGVVGMDNVDFGWLSKRPDLHDLPCRDIELRGVNYTTPNPLTAEPDDETNTGAYVPFGRATQPGEVIRGRLPCSGAVLRVQPSGGELELVAWGFRNPFGLAFDPTGRLFVTENGYDIRGSRPVYGAADHLWAVTPGSWYGWPDFSGGRPLSSDRFKPPLGSGAKEAAPPLGFVLREHPGEPPTPAARLGVHSSSNGLDFARDPRFGPIGVAYIAQFGDMAPTVGKVLSPVGYKVVRVNVVTGAIDDFAANKGKVNGPASWLGSGGLERPVAVRFDPSGMALYVVDFGVMTIERKPSAEDYDPLPRQGTGVLWRVTRESSAPSPGQRRR